MLKQIFVKRGGWGLSFLGALVVLLLMVGLFAPQGSGVVEAQPWTPNPASVANNGGGATQATGRVFCNWRPYPWKQVFLLLAEGGSQYRLVASPTTNASGVWVANGLKTGGYLVQLSAPATTVVTINHVRAPELNQVVAGRSNSFGDMNITSCGGGNAGNSPAPNSGNCVIPPSGPWPPCATGGGGNAGNQAPPPTTNSSGCVIPASGPWPPCATNGGGGNATPTPNWTNPTTPVWQNNTPPLGPNLMLNGGFENGTNGWRPASVRVNPKSAYPNFVYEGESSGILGIFPNQNLAFTDYHVTGLTAEKAYRFQMWVKIWSSDGEDRTVSENPGIGQVNICIHIDTTNFEVSPPASICSSAFSVDTWELVTIDFIAKATTVNVMIDYSSPKTARLNQALLDGGVIGLAPVRPAPTPTPIPPLTPGERPVPVTFNAWQMRSDLTTLQADFTELGGILDRIFHGGFATCDQFMTAYRGVNESATYHSVPANWQGVYSEYIWAVEHVIQTNASISELCIQREGILTDENYGIARTGVHDAQARLIPAIEQANRIQ